MDIKEALDSSLFSENQERLYTLVRDTIDALIKENNNLRKQVELLKKSNHLLNSKVSIREAMEETKSKVSKDLEEASHEIDKTIERTKEISKIASQVKEDNRVGSIGYFIDSCWDLLRNNLSNRVHGSAKGYITESDLLRVDRTDQFTLVRIRINNNSALDVLLDNNYSKNPLINASVSNTRNPGWDPIDLIKDDNEYDSIRTYILESLSDRFSSLRELFVKSNMRETKEPTSFSKEEIK